MVLMRKRSVQPDGICISVKYDATAEFYAQLSKFAAIFFVDGGNVAERQPKIKICRRFPRDARRSKTIWAANEREVTRIKPEQRKGDENLRKKTRNQKLVLQRARSLDGEMLWETNQAKSNPKT